MRGRPADLGTIFLDPPPRRRRPRDRANRRITVSEIRVTIDRLPDQREERTVSTGTTVGQLFAEVFAGDRSNIAGRLRDRSGTGVLIDLDRALADGDVVEPVAIGS